MLTKVVKVAKVAKKSKTVETIKDRTIITGGAIGGCIGILIAVAGFNPSPETYITNDCMSPDDCDYYCESNHTEWVVTTTPGERFICDVFRLTGRVIVGVACGVACGSLTFPFMLVAAPVTIPYFLSAKSSKQYN